MTALPRRTGKLRVCKAWRRVGLRPELWRTLVVDLINTDEAMFGPGAEAFFRSRAAAIESLALRPPDFDYGFTGGVIRAMRGVAPLRRLFLDFINLDGDAQWKSMRTLAWLDSPLEVLCLSGLVEYRCHLYLDELRLERLRVLHLHVYTFNFFLPNQTRRGEVDPFWYIPNALLGEGSPLEELMVSDSLCEDSGRFMSRVGQLARLTSLSFVHAGCGQVPQQWTALTNLRVMRVITKLSDAVVLPDLTALTRLAVLDLSSHTVPPQLQSLRSLKYLTLRGLWVRTGAQEAQIAEEEQPAPASDAEKEQAFEMLLGNGLQLETLRLINCNISAMPAAVQRLTSLRSLTIKRCHLQLLPAGPYLQGLRHLDLFSNCFQHVPLTALAAPQLQTLRLLKYQPPVDMAAHRGSPQGLDVALAELESGFLEELHFSALHEGATSRTVNPACSIDPKAKRLVEELLADCHQHAPDERPEPLVAERLLDWL